MILGKAEFPLKRRSNIEIFRDGGRAVEQYGRAGGRVLALRLAVERYGRAGERACMHQI